MNYSNNLSKQYVISDSNNENINDLDVKIKFDSTKLKKEEFLSKDFKHEITSNHQNNQSNKIVNLAIIESMEKNEELTKVKSKAESRKINLGIRKKNEKLKLLKSINRGIISVKYKIFLATLWIIFLISFIVGFITHFEIKLPVTASGIIWTFSFIFLILASIYSYLYFKINKSDNSEEKLNLLRLFPF